MDITTTRAPGVLDGIRVLDFTQFVAGPYCTRLMADLGATVIKVEPPGGDFLRQTAPMRDGHSTFFAHMNCGKKSITLDLKHPSARAVVHRLVAGCDAVLENFRPGVMRRLGLDYASLRAAKPDLVYCSVSGFGQSGPETQRSAYAPILHAWSGYDMTMMSYHPGQSVPFTSRSAVADVLAATHAMAALCAALVQRERTGKGEYMDVALLDTMLQVLCYEVQASQFEVDYPPPCFPPLPTRDGFIVVAPITDRNFRDLVAATGQPEIADDPRFRTPLDRRIHWGTLMDLLAQWTRVRTSDDAEAVIAAAGCPCSRYLTVEEVMREPHVRERGSITRVHDAAGPLLVANCPMHAALSESTARDAVPELGEHTREVLAQDLGFGPDEIEQLAIDGVFGDAQMSTDAA